MFVLTARVHNGEDVCDDRSDDHVSTTVRLGEAGGSEGQSVGHTGSHWVKLGGEV